MQVVVTPAPVGQSVNQPGIAMEGKDDRLVGGEQRIKGRAGGRLAAAASSD
jgi:hypothetical protein